MIHILHIETATNVCSVAVSRDERILYERIETKGPYHSSHLGVFVEEAMELLREQQIRLDAVAVSQGPGSYTGLRIGVSEAKGLCFGFNLPLIAIPTLEIMALSVSKQLDETDKLALLCPMIDARRMEVYDAIYTADMKQLREVQADILDESSFSEELSLHKIYFFGDGAEKAANLLNPTNLVYVPNIHPLARDMASLALSAYHAKDFVDLAYFEPFYLKDFVATKPKNAVISSQKKS